MSMLTRRHLLATGSAAILLAACGEEQPMSKESPAAAPPAAPKIPAPPVARVEPVTEEFFGVKVTDNYRWMENPKDPEWEPFMKGQADFARRTLDAIKSSAAMQARVSELAGDLEIVAAVQRAGSRVFINKRPAGADNFILFVREGLEGADRVLVDPTQLKQGDVHVSLDWWLASPDGNYIVYGLSPAGSEDSVAQIMEVATGTILPERIDRTQYASPSWAPDGSGFFFNRLAEGAAKDSTDYYKNSVCWFHRLNTDPAADVRVLARGQFAEVPVTEIEFPVVIAPTDSNWAIALLIAGVQNEITAYLAPRAAALAGEGGWRKICVPADRITSVAIKGDDLYGLTYADAPRYKVLKAGAAAPDLAGAPVAVPEGESVIQGFAVAQDAVYLTLLDGGVSRLAKLQGDGGLVPVPLPFEGSFGGVYAEVDRPGVLLNLQSWVRPATIYDIAADGTARETALVAKPPIDVSGFEAVRVFATAGDGTKIPLSIVYKKGVARDGTAPAFIQAYGSYGINSEPFFGPRYIAFMEQGGLWCTANVRGGGEYGRAWHEAGRLLNKPNTWRDLIACAEFLIAEKWSGPGKIGINGGSAGGITVGRALTERPDLFAAVVSQVGVSNSLRAEFGQNGPPNIPEFGSVTTEDGFKGLFAMDSLVHVQDGEKYPGVLLTTGMTDPRVDPWMAAKMAARLQAASTSGRPVLLRVDFDAGHGLGSTRAQLDKGWADAYAFTLWQTGHPDFQPA